MYAFQFSGRHSAFEVLSPTQKNAPSAAPSSRPIHSNEVNVTIL